MKVREEINKYAAKEHKAALIWLFDRYHMQSEWFKMADCTFAQRGLGAPRIWSPSDLGWKTYFGPRFISALEAVLQEGTRHEVDTGIGGMRMLTEAAIEARQLLDDWKRITEQRKGHENAGINPGPAR